MVDWRLELGAIKKLLANEEITLDQYMASMEIILQHMVEDNN
jgi:hypothetical protein